VEHASFRFRVEILGAQDETGGHCCMKRSGHRKEAPESLKRNTRNGCNDREEYDLETEQRAHIPDDAAEE
jgi:hypothetical protein